MWKMKFKNWKVSRIKIHWEEEGSKIVVDESDGELAYPMIIREQPYILITDMLNRLAREERDPVKEKVLRVMGQAAATPHVKWHALIASEYAITLINLLYPKDFDEARKEREWQIDLLQSIWLLY